MARLNEAPCSTESVDALKRRFIRQNRELAKHNSVQSVRIRCLEAEVSRLLAENLQLRGHILQLRNDLDGAPSKRVFGGVKEELEAQVQALARLVAGIGAPQTESKAGKGGATSFPTVGWGRGMADPLDGSDGRLPAIREDKSYPRQTLDAQDIQTIADSESPALGSPPVSHFRDEEPIKFDKPASTEVKKEGEDLASLPANLETRRKKRDSSSKLSIRRMSVFSSPEEEVKANEETKPSTQVLPIRTGAKRKLGSREEDSKPADDFTFSRKVNANCESAEESSSKEEKPREPIKAASRREISKAVPKLSERRALGEKNVNTDPVVSPKKTAKKSAILEEKEVLKKVAEATKEPAKPRVRDRKSRVAVENSIIIPLPDQGTQAPIVAEITPPETKTDLPPKTPAAAADIFSAPSTEDSSRPQTARDTPPPSDLAASTDGNGRPGRRARVQVNYAEPSLAAKMRRPTKEMLDAVGKDGRPLHGILVKKGVEFKLESEDGIGSAWKNMPSVRTGQPIKVEDERAEPGSPLSKKSTGITDTMVVKTEPEPILPSAASQAIAALIRDSKKATKRRSSALRTAQDSDTDTDRKETLGSSIYDFTSSSPPRSTLSSTSRPSSRSSDRDQEDKAKTSRRHSSIASLTAASKDSMLDTSRAAPTRFGSNVTAGHKRTVSGTTVGSSAANPPKNDERSELRASRRRSMML